MLCVISSLAVISQEKMACYFAYCVINFSAFVSSIGAKGLYVACDCGIPGFIYCIFAHLSRRVKVSYCGRSSSVVCVLLSILRIFFFK